MFKFFKKKPKTSPSNIKEIAKGLTEAYCKLLDKSDPKYQFKRNQFSDHAQRALTEAYELGKNED